MIGTRNTAFPRMTACAYWLYLIGGLLLFGGFLSNTGAGRRLVRLRAARRARNTASASAPTSGTCSSPTARRWA